MRLNLAAAAALLALLTFSCKSPSVKGYWEKHTPDITDIRAAEDEFADFAELAVKSPEEEACAEIDRLFDLLSKDEVMYYVYTEWTVTAFYSSASPCRNCPLFVHAMKRVLSDGIVDGYDAEVYERLITACQTNRVGEPLVLPELCDRTGGDVLLEPGQPTLFLVVDLSCPSCVKALEKMASQRPDARHVALCSGPGLLPQRDDWEFYRAIDTEKVYDAAAAPFYFIANSEAIIEVGYTSVL